jgi:uncharacterized membrane protein YraQ (UPF0718 family)/copper chaperone CopZ
MIYELFNEILKTFVAMAPYLLIGLFFAGVLHVFVDPKFISKHLGNDSFGSVVKAAVFGIPLPLCSCGVLPVALSLRKGKASNGSTVSFLISTPQTGIDSLIATWGMLGPVFAIFRPFAAIIMGIFGGIITNLFSAKNENNNIIDSPKVFECNICYKTTPHSHTFLQKIKRIFTYAYGNFFDDISVNLTIGLILAGFVSFFIPDNFFDKYVSNEFISMLLMILLGIPMYSCVTASIPVAVALMLKGLSPGAAFVYLTVAPATNFSFILVIKQVMGKKIVSIYIISLAVMSILMGYILNAIFGIVGTNSLNEIFNKHFHHDSETWEVILSAIFFIVIIFSFARKIFTRNYFKKLKGNIQYSCVFSVSGMHCNNCAKKIEESLKKVEGVSQIDIDIKNGIVKVNGTAKKEDIKSAVEEAGYNVLRE